MPFSVEWNVQKPTRLTLGVLTPCPALPAKDIVLPAVPDAKGRIFSWSLELPKLADSCNENFRFSPSPAGSNITANFALPKRQKKPKKADRHDHEIAELEDVSAPPPSAPHRSSPVRSHHQSASFPLNRQQRQTQSPERRPGTRPSEKTHIERDESSISPCISPAPAPATEGSDEPSKNSSPKPSEEKAENTIASAGSDPCRQTTANYPTGKPSTGSHHPSAGTNLPRHPIQSLRPQHTAGKQGHMDSPSGRDQGGHKGALPPDVGRPSHRGDVSYRLDAAAAYDSAHVPPSAIPDKYHVVDRAVVPLPEMYDEATFHELDKKWHMKMFPSNRPVGRKDVYMLREWLDSMLDSLNSRPGSFQDIERLTAEAQIYDWGEKELARQVSMHCNERGELMLWLWSRQCVLFDSLKGRMQPQPPQLRSVASMPGGPVSAETDDQSAALAAVSSDLAQRNGSLAATTALYEKQKALTLSLLKDLNEQEAETAELRLQLTDKDTELTKLRKMVEEKDLNVRQLQGQLSDTSLHVNRLVWDLRQKAQQLVQWKRLHAQANLEANRLSAELALKDDIIQRIREEVQSPTRSDTDSLAPWLEAELEGVQSRSKEMVDKMEERLQEEEELHERELADKDAQMHDFAEKLHRLNQMLSQRDIECSKLQAQLRANEKTTYNANTQTDIVGARERQHSLLQLPPAPTQFAEQIKNRKAEQAPGPVIPSCSLDKGTQFGPTTVHRWTTCDIISAAPKKAQDTWTCMWAMGWPVGPADGGPGEDLVGKTKPPEEPLVPSKLEGLDAEKERNSVGVQWAPNEGASDDEKEQGKEAGDQSEVPKEVVREKHPKKVLTVKTLEELVATSPVEMGDADGLEQQEDAAAFAGYEARPHEIPAGTLIELPDDGVPTAGGKVKKKLRILTEPVMIRRPVPTGGIMKPSTRRPPSESDWRHGPDTQRSSHHTDDGDSDPFSDTDSAHSTAGDSEEPSPWEKASRGGRAKGHGSYDDPPRGVSRSSHVGSVSNRTYSIGSSDSEPLYFDPQAQPRGTAESDLPTKSSEELTKKKKFREKGTIAIKFKAGNKKQGFFGKDLRGRPTSLKKVLSTIIQIYGEKLDADRIDDREGNDHGAMLDFVYDFHLNAYGLTTLAEKNLKIFLASVIKYSRKSSIVHLFSRFLDLDTISFGSPHCDLYLGIWEQIQLSGMTFGIKDPTPAHGVLWVNSARLVDTWRRLQFDSIHPDFLNSLTNQVKTTSVQEKESKLGRDVAKIDFDSAMEWALDELSRPDREYDEYLTQVFHQGDSNHDGVLTLSEFSAILRKINPTLSKRVILKAFKDSIAAAGSECLTPQAFVSACRLNKLVRTDIPPFPSILKISACPEKTPHKQLANRTQGRSRNLSRFSSILRENRDIDVSEGTPNQSTTGRSHGPPSLESTTTTTDPNAASGAGTIDGSDSPVAAPSFLASLP